MLSVRAPQLASLSRLVPRAPLGLGDGEGEVENDE